MLNDRELTALLKEGRISKIQVNGTYYQLNECEAFRQNRNGCSGIAGGVLEFALAVEEVPEGAVCSLSFSARGEAELGDIVLIGYAGAVKVHPGCSVYAFADTLGDQFVRRAADCGGVHETRPMCLVYDLERKENFFAGQLTFDKNNMLFTLRFSPGGGTLEYLECRIPGCGFRPGSEKTVTDKLFIRTAPPVAPYETLCQWGDMVKEVNAITVPDRIVAGFITGLMVSVKAESSAQQIRRQLEAVPSLVKLGMEYLWISIDNLKSALAGNWLIPNDQNFPGGLRNFLDEICSHGIRPGLWIGLFQMCENSDLFEKTAPFLIRRKNGELADRGTWQWGMKKSNGELPLQYALDPGKEENLAFLKEVFSTYAQWGVRYHMVDFLETGLYGRDEITTGYDQEAYRTFLKKLKSFCHPETQMLSATGSSIALCGAVPSSRIGMDYGEGRPLETQFPSFPANYVINGSFGSAGSPNRNAVNNLAMWAFAHDRFFQCSSNMMTVDKPIPLNEARISATLFGISPSPVFFGDDMAAMSPERLALIKKVLPRMPGMPEPVDLFRRTEGEKDFLRTFVLKIEKPFGTWYVAAVFNLDEKFREVILDAGEMHLDPEKKYRMYNFWEESYCGEFVNSRTVEIAGNSAAVFRFEESKAHPWILSSDFHLRQGQAEFESLAWDEESRTLSGKLRRTAGERGNIFIIAHESFIPENFNRGLMVSKSAIDNSLIIKKEILFTGETESWQLHFD